MNKLPTAKRVQILNMLVEGMSMRATSRVAEVSINTVSNLLTNAFSKRIESHLHMLSLYFVHDDFCRVHKCLRVPQAGSLKLTHHPGDCPLSLASVFVRFW